MKFVSEFRHGTYKVEKEGLSLLTFPTIQKYKVTPNFIQISAKNIQQLYLNLDNTGSLLCIDNQNDLYELSKMNGLKQSFEEFVESSTIILKAEDLGYVGGYPKQWSIRPYVVCSDKVLVLKTKTECHFNDKFILGQDLDSIESLPSREELLRQNELKCII